MKSQFLELYDAFKNEKVDIKNILKQSNKLKSGYFYSIIQTSETDKPFNCNPICICIGLSEKDKNSYNVIDLCYLPIDLRIKFIDLFFKTYNDQIDGRLFDSDAFNDISNFNLRNVQSLLKIFNISNAITKIHIKDIKSISVIDFIDVPKIVNLIDNKDNFKNTTIKEQQVKTLSKLFKK